MSLHSYHDLLQEYFDEGLDSVHEETLFAEMGRNGELRSEFARMMRLHKTVQADVAHIKAPASATEDIFRRIAPVPVLQPSSSVVRRIGAFAATAFVAMLATSAVFLLGDFGKTNSPVNSAVATNSTNTGSPVRPFTAPPHVDMPPVDQASVSSAAEEKIAQVQSQPARSATRNFPVRTEEPEEHTEPEQAINHSSFRAPASIGSINRNNHSIPSLQAADLLHRGSRPGEDGTVVLSLRGIAAGESGISVTGQMSAGILYALDDNHALGIEAGQEPFTFVSELDVHGDVVEFRSTETLPWATAVYRLSLPDFGIERTVYPFAQIGVGAARGGALGKAQIGLVLQPEQRVTFSLGLESSALMRPQASPLTVLRWTYGVGVRL